MKDCKFKQLIIDMYKDSKTRTFTKNEFGMISTYNSYFGILYDPTSTNGFNDILDIEKYMDIANPDMLLLHSRVHNKEIEIYNWKLLDYNIKDDKLYIQLKNKELIFDLG